MNEEKKSGGSDQQKISKKDAEHLETDKKLICQVNAIAILKDKDLKKS